MVLPLRSGLGYTRIRTCRLCSPRSRVHPLRGTPFRVQDHKVQGEPPHIRQLDQASPVSRFCICGAYYDPAADSGDEECQPDEPPIRGNTPDGPRDHQGRHQDTQSRRNDGPQYHTHTQREHQDDKGASQHAACRNSLPRRPGERRNSGRDTWESGDPTVGDQKAFRSDEWRKNRTVGTDFLGPGAFESGNVGDDADTDQPVAFGCCPEYSHAFGSSPFQNFSGHATGGAEIQHPVQIGAEPDASSHSGTDTDPHGAGPFKDVCDPGSIPEYSFGARPVG
jgi:hypothetical protein